MDEKRIDAVFKTCNADKIFVCSDNTVFTKEPDAKRQCELKKEVSCKTISREQFYKKPSSGNREEAIEKIKNLEDLSTLTYKELVVLSKELEVVTDAKTKEALVEALIK